MATNTKLSIAVAIAMCNALVDAVDVGSGTAKIEIRSGTQPSDPDAAAGGTLLASINLPNPAYGAASDQAPNALATLLGVPLSDPSANNTGTAAWFRLYDRDGTAIMDGTVGTSDADLLIDNTSINSGQQVNVNQHDVIVPQ